MERVLANLLQNAAKYSPQGTLVRISARLNEDGELELAVEDERSEVRGEDRQRIFEPFFRSSTRATTESGVPGHGLGLAICQSIVLAHGGSMRVADRPGGGAKFIVNLPMRPQRTRRRIRRK